jgi:hypothetical protein
MPNVSEMYRKDIEMKNDQLKRLETSRNANTEHHRLCQEMREVRAKMSDPTMPKGAKADLLARLRTLEKQTGFDSIPYNSSEF